MRAKRRVAGLLAAGVMTALAFSGAVGAGSALACTGTPILGQGSVMQKVAQEIWIKESGLCVTYDATGSRAGLKAFGVGGLETPESSKDVFIGADTAPNVTQLKEIDKAANGAGEKGQAIVIPMLQTSIAIIAKPPSGCTITKIDNSDLENVFDGTLKNWSEISTASGTCSSPIIRVVPKDSSGATYQFKHYLFEIDKAVQSGDGSRTWEELQPEPTPNLEWPEGVTLSTVVKPVGNGDAEEVAKVKSEAGSIGYAYLGDAAAGSITTLEVQNNGVGTREQTYASPVTGEKEANCSGATYIEPEKAKEADADWSKVYGGNPNIGGTTYPICTLTWDVALKSAALAKLTAAEGAQCKKYMEYAVSVTGQEKIKKHYYAVLSPSLETLAEELAQLIG